MPEYQDNRTFFEKETANSKTKSILSKTFEVVGFCQIMSANTVWTQAFAVPVT